MYISDKPVLSSSFQKVISEIIVYRFLIQSRMPLNTFSLRMRTSENACLYILNMKNICIGINICTKCSDMCTRTS